MRAAVRCLVLLLAASLSRADENLAEFEHPVFAWHGFAKMPYRLFKPASDPSTSTTPPTSWNCFPDLVTRWDCPRACVIGEPGRVSAGRTRGANATPFARTLRSANRR
jgi:hypothetical protein